jgi:hypothetical protein
MGPMVGTGRSARLKTLARDKLNIAANGSQAESLTSSKSDRHYLRHPTSIYSRRQFQSGHSTKSPTRKYRIAQPRKGRMGT